MERERGFSLLEVLIATTVFTAGVTALAQLAAVTTRANSSARVTTMATVLAAQKMEQLLGLMWGVDGLGQPLSDTSTDTTVVPEGTGGRGLSPSPADSLTQNTGGYCDFLDRHGRSLGGGATVPLGTVFIRRWSIRPLPTNPVDTLVLQVLVTQGRSRTEDDTTGDRRLPDEARIISVKTRKGT